jgi:3-phosphoglycerate kinase
VQGLDIGPESLQTFKDALSDCKTVLWNGPLGVFEMDKFAAGTLGVAETLAELTGKVSSEVYMCVCVRIRVCRCIYVYACMYVCTCF